MSRKLDNVLPVIWATFFRGAARFNRREKANGIADMKESLDRMARMESILALRYFYSVYAECLVLFVNDPEAESILKKTASLGESVQNWGEIISYRTMGLLAAAKKDQDWLQADVHLNRTISLSVKTGAATELLICYSRFARLMHKKGDAEGEQFYYRQGRTLAAQLRQGRR